MKRKVNRKSVKSESLNKGMEVYADNENQLEVIQDIIPILDKKGIKLRFGSRVGKSPQTIIFDNEFQDGALRISGNGYNSGYLPTWYGDEFDSADDLEDLIDNYSDENDEYGGGSKTNSDKFMRGGIAGDVYSLQNPEQFKELITIYNDLSEKTNLIKGYYLDHTDKSIVFLTAPNISDLGKDEIYSYVESLKEKGFSIIDFDKSVNYKKYQFGLDWGTEKGSMIKQDGKEVKGNPQWFKLYLKRQIKYDGGGETPMARNGMEVINFYANDWVVIGNNNETKKWEILSKPAFVAVANKNLKAINSGARHKKTREKYSNFKVIEQDRFDENAVYQYAKGGEIKKAEHGMEVDDLKGGLKNYYVQVEYSGGGVSKLIVTDSYEEAEKFYYRAIEDMDYDEIDYAEFVAEFNNGEKEIIDFEYADAEYKSDDEYGGGGETPMARNGMEVKNWSASDVSNAKYLGILEFEDAEGEFHNFEVMETEDKLVFGGMTNSGFIESGYIEKDGRSTDETLQNLMEDLEVYYNDGAEYTSEIVVNQRMANGGTFGGGGSIAEGNYHMILSQAKEVQHHVDELQDILKKEDTIEAWVVAKMENVSSTLSDVTHYLDGKSEMPMAKRGMKVGSKQNDITLTQSEKNQYKKIISELEKADFGRIKMGEECYDEKEMIEDKIYGLQVQQEEFKYKLLEKYGNTPQIQKAIDSQLYESLYESMVKGRKTKKAKDGMRVDKIEYPSISLKEKDLNDDQTEIYAYIETRQELQSQYDTIRKNLMTKIARGEFDETKAPKLFMYLIENGLKLYSKNFGEIRLSKQEKDEIANNMVVDFMSEAELRNYENETFLPKKYLAENGMVVRTYDIYDEDGQLEASGLVAQDVIDYANLRWYYDMMDEDGEEIDDFDVARDYLEQDGFNIESHNPEKSSSATKKRKIIRKMKK